MSLKVIVLFAFLAVAFAGRPYFGFRIPKFDMTQVVGGDEAKEHDYPFIASLQWGLREGSESHFCACTILNENWLVTAGHCILAVPDTGVLFAKVGKHNIGITENTEQKVQIVKTIVHKDYGGDVGPYDIGLLKTNTPIKFNREVQPVNLPAKGSEPSGTPIIAGWGSTSRTGIPNMPDKLQDAKLTYVSIKDCDDAVRRLTGSSPVHETNVCTGPLTGGMSACSGDSGGPLCEKDSSGTTIIGIVSWGIVPCGTTGAPSVYTKVSSYIDWINENMQSN